MKVIEWLCCPICGNKTRVRIREDTELKNFPLYSREGKAQMMQTYLHHLSAPAGLLDIQGMSVKQRPKRSGEQIPRPSGANLLKRN